jgi:hypothetical protein
MGGGAYKGNMKVESGIIPSDRTLEWNLVVGGG